MPQEFKIGTILTIEAKSCFDAELEWFKYNRDGGWEVLECMKVVWSWKKFRAVCRFKIIKVSEPRPNVWEEVIKALVPKIQELVDGIENRKRRQELLN